MINKAATLAILIAISGTGIATSSANAANVPCEEMLKEMRATKAAAKLSDADMKKVDDLEAKAVERCNADDDARSDKFSADAMAVMGKQP